MVDAVELMAKILHPEVFNVTMPHVISDDYVDWVSSSLSNEADALSLTDGADIMEIVIARTE